jgi:hypothetical protein
MKFATDADFCENIDAIAITQNIKVCGWLESYLSQTAIRQLYFK